MKPLYRLLLMITMTLMVSCSMQPPERLIPHRCANGKFGYVDEKGKEWIEGQYDYADEFSEDLAVVKIGNYFGYIDRSGEIVIPLQYDIAFPFENGRAKVVKESLYGYIDPNNQAIIPCLYEKIEPYSPMEAYAVKNGKTGIIDNMGKELVPFKYDKIRKMNEELYVVTNSGRDGFLNARKQEILPCEYSYSTMEGQNGESLIVLRTKESTQPYFYSSAKSKYGLMDLHGNILAPCKYERIGAFINGNLAHVILNDKVGYINSDGKEVIPPIYDQTRILSGNRYTLYKDGLCYLADSRTGQWVTSQVYNKIEQYRDSLYKVTLNDKFGMIDTDGKVVLEPIYDQMYRINDWLHLYIKGKGTDGYAGRATAEDARLIIPCNRYISIGNFNKDGGRYAEVKKAIAKYTYRSGVVNREGKEVVPCQYNHIYIIENGRCMVMEPGTNKRLWVKLNE